MEYLGYNAYEMVAAGPTMGAIHVAKLERADLL